MKKNYFLNMVSLIAIGLGGINAQVVNGRFENIKDNGHISNWGSNFLFPVSIDIGSGETIEDTVTFGCWPGFVFPTFDSNHGQYAMQITNGLAQTSNTVFAGKSIIFNDATQDSPGWNPGIFLNTNDSVTMLGFYYKFFPVGNDVAEAELIVFDEDSNELGRATAEISQTTPDYTYLYEPVQFTASGTPAFMHITFSMAKEGSVPTFGSTLMIDDVVVNFAALAKDEFQSSQFAIFPTLAQHEINILKGKTAASGQYDFIITNIEGKIIRNQTIQLLENNPVAIDVSQLSKGIYMISSKGYSTKFIKE